MDRGLPAARIKWTLGLTALTSAALMFLASPALARTFMVNRADDPNPPGPCSAGDCSLRAAVFAADDHSGPDTIRFANSLPPKIELTEGSLPVRFKVTIDGPGSRKLAVSATQQSRVFHMLGGHVTLRGITIRDGRETAVATGPHCPGSSASSFTLGGGILQDAGDLKLDRVKMANNAVLEPGSGGIIGGGGVAMIEGKLSIDHSRFTQNASLGAAISEGGAVFSCAGSITIKKTNIHDSTVTSHAIADGGGVIAKGPSGQDTPALKMKKSTVASNDVSSEAITEGGGVSVVNAPAEIDSSTISDNNGTVTGGGSIVEGAGLFVANTKATVTNSTIANNLATAPDAVGGGILVGGSGEKLVMRSSTVAGNIADGTTDARGGNLAGAASAKLRNTIVARGKATTGPNCDAPVKSSGHDLEDKDTCGFNGKGDRVNRNPKLGHLKDNGGPTDTMALKRGSPAIDHASRKSSPSRDQRGFKRGRKPDIGAYEFGAKP